MNIFSKNKYKPYWSKSMNKEFLMAKSSTELEKIGRKQNPPIELDKRMKREKLVDLLYDAL